MLHLFQELGAEGLAEHLCDEFYGMDAASARCGYSSLHNVLELYRYTDDYTYAVKFSGWHYDSGYECITAEYSDAESDDYVTVTIEIDTEGSGVINYVRVSVSGEVDGEEDSDYYEISE